MFIKKAFTLAEVLITLGILGIVASVTIPTIMQSSNGTKHRAAFKSGLATLNQAVLMSSTQYNLDFANAKQQCSDEYISGDIGEDTNKSFCLIFGKTLSAAKFSANLEDNKTVAYNYALNSGSTISSSDFGYSDYSVYTLSNGMFLAFYPYDKSAAPCRLRKNETLTPQWLETHPQCLGFLDVNGVNLPNREVACTDGTETNYEFNKPCTVNKKSVTDIFPVVFYNTSVEPASNAAAYVLNTAK